MKKHIVLSILSLILFSYNTPNDCEQTYTNVSHGLTHAKKALKTNNYDDQRYLAKQALDAYYRVLEDLNDCGGDAILEKVEDTIKYLEIASDPYDWSKGRFYSKKAYLKSLDIITELDELTAQN